LQVLVCDHCHKDIISNLDMGACLKRVFGLHEFLDSFYFLDCLLIKKHFLLAYVKRFSCLFHFCLYYEFDLGIVLRMS
jgi:hypothetical protein